MIPLITAFNHYVQQKITGLIIDEGRAEIQAQRAQLDRLRAENRIRTLEREKLENELIIAKQSIEIESLNRSNMMLERARLQMSSFQQIAELALTQANFMQTMVRMEPTTPLETGWGLRAEYFHDEVLVISTYDLNAKFGIDLGEVKVVRTANNSVFVSGIRPKFIGSDRFEHNNLLKEIRRVDYRHGMRIRETIRNDMLSRTLADNKAQQFHLEFQRRLSEGLELSFMDDAIVQLAQNFIRIVLTPLFDIVEFDNIERPEALPLMAFLTSELREADEEKFNLLQMNEQAILRLDLLERELAELETEFN
jgi:hypothetical protein